MFKNLRPLFPYLRKYQTTFWIGALCVLCNNGVWILFPLVIRRAIDDLNLGVTRHKLFTYSALLLAVAGVKAIFQYLTRWILIGVSREIEFDLRNDLFAHLERLSYSFYQRTRTGDIMARMTNDLNAVRMLVGPGIMYTANTIVFTAGRADLHAQHQPQADDVRLRAAAHRQHRGAVLRPQDSRALRAHSGDVFRHLRPGAGKLFRRAPHPRLCAGRGRDRSLRARQPGIHRPQPQTGSPDGNALAYARDAARRRHRHRALGRRATRSSTIASLSAASWPSTPTWCS